MNALLYFEDLAVGQRFRSDGHPIDDASIKTFAAAYDPQPFHLDEVAARETLFGGLAASGWQTAAVTMRLLVTGEMTLAGGLIGAGIEELRWPKPVRPGDVLAVESEILDLRESRSNPRIGLVRVRSLTTNQSGDIVQSMISSLVVQRRSA